MCVYIYVDADTEHELQVQAGARNCIKSEYSSAISFKTAATSLAHSSLHVEDCVARAAKAKAADALKQKHVHKTGGPEAFLQGPKKKIRQREHFNQAQRKRLVEVYDMEESHRPDIDQLAKELDQIEGGRHVDAAAVKIWIMNRYHSLKRTAGGKAQVESYAQKQGDANKVAVWPSHAPALVGGVNDTWNSFQCANKGRKVTTAERKAAQGELLLWEEHPKAEAAAQEESDGEENDSKNESEAEEELHTAQVLHTAKVSTSHNSISKTSNHKLSGGAKVNTHVHASMVSIGCRPQRARKQVKRIRSSELTSTQRASPLAQGARIHGDSGEGSYENPHGEAMQEEEKEGGSHASNSFASHASNSFSKEKEIKTACLTELKGVEPVKETETEMESGGDNLYLVKILQDLREQVPGEFIHAIVDGWIEIEIS